MRNILLRSANAKPYFFLNEMNKKDLPTMYSTAYWRLFVVLLVFWLYCVTTVTPLHSLCIKLNQLVTYGTFYFDSHLKEHLMEEMELGEEAADRILNVSVAFTN